MDPKATHLPAKPLSSKPKFTRKVPSEAPQISAHQPPISRQKRVFGTVRSSNIPIKTVNERAAAKPLIGAVKRQPKSTRLAQPAVNGSAKPLLEATSQKITERLNPRPKKKSPGGIKQQATETTPKDCHVDNNVVEPQTPVAVPRLFKLKKAGTPYHTAEKCSNCRLDKMETSSYWLSQIKLAESVGKHFVSADFFRLAHVCNAEPSRTLIVEVKRYLSRHGHLSSHTEWKDVCLSYGLVEDNINVGSELNKDDQSATTESGMVESSGSEGDKDQIVGSNVGEAGSETRQGKGWPTSLSWEAEHIHPSIEVDR